MNIVCNLGSIACPTLLGHAAMRESFHLKLKKVENLFLTYTTI